MSVLRRCPPLAASVLAVAAWVLVGAPGADAAPPSCSPGSGPDFHARRLTAAYLQRRPDLRCANLAGADLSGLSLVQQDLGRAVLREANLTGTDLTQADLTEADLTSAHLGHARLIQVTLTDAVLRGADLTNADLGQVDAQRADFTEADLSGADLTQAHLENAHLDRADIGGATTTQAYLHGTSFSYARGVTPWDRYLLIGCAVLYAFLVAGAVRTHLRRGTRSKLPQAILGRMIMVVGIHLFAGFVLGQIASTSGPPVDQTCHGVQCSLGVAAGSWAPYVGFLLIFVGATVSGSTGRRRVSTGPMLGGKLPAQFAALSRARSAPAVPPAAAWSAPAGPPPSTPPLTSLSTRSSAPGRVLTPEQSLLPPEVLQLALAGDKRAAARRYRELTGGSRWEAKSVLQDL